MDIKVNPKTEHEERDSFGELLGQLAGNYVVMFHDEMELIIQRIREKERSVRGGLILVATGAVICFAAFLVFCSAAITMISSYMHPATAMLATGGVLIFASAVVGLMGYRLLRKPTAILEKDKSFHKETMK